MHSPADAISLLVTLEFVVMAAIVLLLVPFGDVVSVVPLFLLFVIALALYWQ